MAGKFDSNRDSFLHWACTQEWGMGSDGNVEAPTGYFWQIEFIESEVGGNNTAFNSLLEEWLELEGESDSLAFRASLMGCFILTENSQGFVSVARYDYYAAMNQDFMALQAIFEEWQSEAGE